MSKYVQLILKPCPFCGGRAKPYKGIHGWTAECDQCAVNIGWFNTLMEAVNKWNTRYCKR